MLLACPDPNCAVLNPQTATQCEECGRQLVLGYVAQGYRHVSRPGHPLANKNGTVRLHRVIAMEAIGRPLKPGEVVHHINGDRSDNRPENLHVFASTAEHSQFHQLELRRKGEAA